MLILYSVRLSGSLDPVEKVNAFVSGILVFFFYFFYALFLDRDKVTIYALLHTVHALFMGPTTTLFIIKKKSYDTIYTFKNYFTIMFLIFNFQQNKLYLNKS